LIRVTLGPVGALLRGAIPRAVLACNAACPKCCA